ncbi:MAG TPA: hypothetical protein VFV38_45930, partial [Ktedonobacteraceae bacterium]|nr:hypothetical protein [Ktedonobacteraceae bacterium]
MPLIYTNSAYALIFGLVFLCWAISEFVGPVRWGRSKQGKRRDRGSILMGVVSGLSGVGCALWFPLLFPGARMWQPSAFFAGMGLIFLGIGWRWYAI